MHENHWDFPEGIEGLLLNHYNVQKKSENGFRKRTKNNIFRLCTASWRFPWGNRGTAIELLQCAKKNIENGFRKRTKNSIFRLCMKTIGISLRESRDCYWAIRMCKKIENGFRKRTKNLIFRFCTIAIWFPWGSRGTAIGPLQFTAAPHSTSLRCAEPSEDSVEENFAKCKFWQINDQDYEES